MLPHRAELDHGSISCFFIFFYKFPVGHRDPGAPVLLFMTRHKSDLLKVMVWPYLTVPMSA